ncbi:MAG: glycosyltransferase family 9 protein [Candidatus Contendobacter sp.]|nr:glycosyltransferase family 9 protein [Candidatus Contendobacter sp.]
MTISQDTGQPRRILIYRLGSLGDTVVALPALRLIARAFPEAERWILTNFSISTKAAPLAEILDGTGLVHGYIEYPLGLRNVRKLLDLRRRIRRHRFERLIYLQPPRGGFFKALRDATFFYSCGIGALIGVPYRTEFQRCKQLDEGHYEYEGARLLRCISALGQQDLDDPSAFDLCLSPAEQEAAINAIAALNPRKPIIAASIGAKLDLKDWEDDNWAALFEDLSRTHPEAQLILVGAGVEYNRSQRLAQHWHGLSLNLCGLLTVRETAVVLSRARLFIGHDSGPMHLAAAVKTPCVAIFSARNQPGEWFPHGRHHRIFYKSVPCRGCQLMVCEHQQKRCIRSITVDEVRSAVLELMVNQQ